MLGHNRYSTAGMKTAINCIQPFVLHTTVGLIAIAHNGELVNAHLKRSQVWQNMHFLTQSVRIKGLEANWQFTFSIFCYNVIHYTES